MPEANQPYDSTVRIVNDAGEADMTIAVVGDQVVNLEGATPGYVLTVQNDGTVAPEASAGGGGGGAVASVNGRTGVVTGLAEQSSLTAEAALARNADNLASGTVADARIASTIARDSEVTAAVAAVVGDAIADGVTTIAPSQNAVFDGLALKVAKAGDTMTGGLITTSVKVSGESGMSNITPLRLLGILNHTGAPVGADGTFAVGDFILDSVAQEWVCTVAGSPGTWIRTGAGMAIARASSTSLETIGTSEADFAGMSVSFDSPSNRDLWVFARIPTVGAATASAIATVKLTDGSNVAKDSNSARSGTISRNHVTLSLDEVIPAGSGAGLVRKLRGICTTADGYANNAAASRITLDVFVR